MVDLNDIPSAPLKVVFVVHFILTAWGLGQWCPLSYLFYNLLFFLILLWAVHHKESDEPMQMAVAVSAVCLVLDVMVISLYFPRNNVNKTPPTTTFLNIQLYHSADVYRMRLQLCSWSPPVKSAIDGIQSIVPRILGSVEQNWKLSSTDMLERIPVIGGHYQAANMRDGSERFSCGMAILNLIIRPFTTLVLYRIYVERANAAGAPLPAIFGGTAQRGPYEDIVGGVHQSVPHTDIPSPMEYPPNSKMPPAYHS